MKRPTGSETARSRTMVRGVPILVFLALWELAARFGPFSATQLFPPFSAVLEELVRLYKTGVLSEHLVRTLGRVLIGLCLGTTLGVVTGTVMGWHKATDRSLSPIVSLLYPIPALGWLPLMMLWIGINEMLPVAIITVGAFFPSCYNTAAGLRSVDGRLIDAARILGASEWRILFEVALPCAATHLFAGLRLSSGMAWRTVLAAEMVAIPTGIGALIMKAESLVRVESIMSCLLVLSVFCLVFEKFFDFLEKKWVGTWRERCA
ncbi:MAG: ABC transporter permease [Desulfobulbus sp.]|nr:ABC transporter permease [Desulfobulbus sp.]